jgi:hypothetical protein
MATPALCVHIPFSHCPEHAIQWHSLPLPFMLHSCGFVGSQEPLSFIPGKCAGRLGFFWLRAPLPVVFAEDNLYINNAKFCK